MDRVETGLMLLLMNELHRSSSTSVGIKHIETGGKQSRCKLLFHIIFTLLMRGFI